MGVGDGALLCSGQSHLSGGQRRRVNIGVELVADPTVLFLDEPTSGLSATDALVIMKSLWSLSCLQCTVVAVIHSPRAVVYKLFSSVLLLGAGAAPPFKRSPEPFRLHPTKLCLLIRMSHCDSFPFPANVGRRSKSCSLYISVFPNKKLSISSGPRLRKLMLDQRRQPFVCAVDQRAHQRRQPRPLL